VPPPESSIAIVLRKLCERRLRNKSSCSLQSRRVERVKYSERLHQRRQSHRRRAPHEGQRSARAHAFAAAKHHTLARRRRSELTPSTVAHVAVRPRTPTRRPQAHATMTNQMVREAFACRVL